jgi:cytochrome oxidase Cu insertion factor (SCO1/SenC/PrrC family)
MLVLILAFFALPLVVAWVLNFNGDFVPGATTNNGMLVQPVRPVTAVDLFDARGGAVDAKYFIGKWTMLYRHSGACDDVCQKTLYTVRQVRLTQGKNIDRIQRLLLLEGASMPAWVATAAEQFPGMDIALATNGAAADAFGVAGRIYLIDPLGNLMMEYALDAEPRGMTKDLQRLLLISYVG